MVLEVHPTMGGYGLWDTERQRWHVRDESHAIVDQVADALTRDNVSSGEYTECDEIADHIRAETGEDRFERA